MMSKVNLMAKTRGQMVLLDDVLGHNNTEGYISRLNGVITLEIGMKQRCHTTQERKLCLQLLTPLSMSTMEAPDQYFMLILYRLTEG
jgi:hypothetical protein